ncbi:MULTISPECIES: M48 family metallopeptidase [Dethiosulfovibrio]|uniref:M48 family metallopeptidase n=2 Tax=Dethiosulfovibrio TaxID=47054 RepID=A0ABS9EJD6_9BACT|nr:MULTISPECIES: SprT family zinc-dependent metalloprotease [Dethiosulfovibrio]MCF4112849.1 M48 family metallopeptidase [Dethiosulfovibrio russensis]MCF4141313.1 M48 family metallopeptidase [Dethiosulfovibrio marinus]MCF4145643.1 M48 family metallopeptidase [Dethiosulfovibrio acidaminovorans]
MARTLSFPYGDTVIRFHPVYSGRRKTVEIAVEAPGRVIVTAPEGRSDGELIALVSKKAEWITRQLYDMKAVRFQPVARELVSGESLLYLGRNYRLDIGIDETFAKPTVKLDHGVFRIRSRSADPSLLRDCLIAWYREKAATQTTARVRYFSPRLNVTPAGVRIRDQKKRWGSCTPDGTLLFNWRSVMAPSPVLDYIVAHELCHLLETPHSTRFWNLLRAVMPQYESRKQWLKENGVKLDV